MSVYKKNPKINKWYCKFQVNKKQYHRLCKGATTKAKAKELEAIYIVEIQKQRSGVSQEKEKPKVKLKELKDNYLLYSKINRAVYKQDIGRLNIAFQFFDENSLANSIVRKDIEEFKDWLLNRGLSKKTVNMYLGIFRTMYNLAISDELLTKNPFANKVEFKIEPKDPKYLSYKSQETLEKATPDYFKPIITTALNSGLRRGNIIDLQWKNLNFDFRTIEITKNKGNKKIKIPMNDTLYDLFTNMERKSEYVFLNPNTGEKWNETAFNKLWRKIREKAGLDDLKFHGLRHTVCTRLIQNNVPIPIAKEILAHSDIKTTLQYTHVDSLDKINAVKTLDTNKGGFIQNKNVHEVDTEAIKNPENQVASGFVNGGR